VKSIQSVISPPLGIQKLFLHLKRGIRGGGLPPVSHAWRNTYNFGNSRQKEWSRTAVLLRVNH